MNIVFLTVEERLYYPAFFHRVLLQRAGDTRAVFKCPMRLSRYGLLTSISRYRASFGWFNLMKLLKREVRAHVFDRLGVGRPWERFYSIEAVTRHHGVPCETVADVNAQPFRERLTTMQTDLIVAVGCPQIFKRPLISLPPRGCLNVHGSLLPKYRGLAPSFWMMHNGERQAGVTVFFINEGIDLGDAVETERFPIHAEETLEQFIIRSRQVAADTLLRAIQKIDGGLVEVTPLDEEMGSYHTFPTREAYREFRRRGRKIW